MAAQQSTDMHSADRHSDVRPPSPSPTTPTQMVRTLGSLFLRATWSQRDHPTTLKILREAVQLTEEFLGVVEEELGSKISPSRNHGTASLPKLLMDVVGVRMNGYSSPRRIELLRDMKLVLEKEVVEARREVRRLQYLLEGMHKNRRRRRRREMEWEEKDAAANEEEEVPIEESDSVKKSLENSDKGPSCSRHTHVTRAAPTRRSKSSKASEQKMSGALLLGSGDQKRTARSSKANSKHEEQKTTPEDSVRAWVDAVAASNDQISPRSRSIATGSRKESERKVKTGNPAVKTSKASSSNHDAAPSSRKSAGGVDEAKTESREVSARRTSDHTRISTSSAKPDEKGSTRTKTSKSSSGSSKMSHHSKTSRAKSNASHGVDGKASTSSVPSKTSSEHATISSSKVVGDKIRSRGGSSYFSERVHAEGSAAERGENVEGASSSSKKSSSKKNSTVPLLEAPKDPDEAERSKAPRSNSISSRTSSERAIVSSRQGRTHTRDGSRHSSKSVHPGEIAKDERASSRKSSARSFVVHARDISEGHERAERTLTHSKSLKSNSISSRTSSERATVSSSKHLSASRRSSKSEHADEVEIPADGDKGALTPDKKRDSASTSREVLEIKGGSKSSRSNSRTSTEHGTASSNKHSMKSRSSSKSTHAVVRPRT